MAVPLSNNFSLCSPRLTASSITSKPYKSPKPFKTLALLSSQSHHHYHHNRGLIYKKPNFGISFPNSYPTISSRSVKSFLTVEDDSTVETSEEDEPLPNDVEELESDAIPESSSSLKSLLQEYKEAILNGDEKTTSEIEATICQVETEKDEQVGKVATLSAEITSAREKYLRLQADFDNFRKRSEKERLTVRSDAQGAVIESLLPMVDNFERAKQQLKIETEKEKQIDASYQGIYKQFVEIMKSLNVAIVPTVGRPFDPLFHEAIAREESQEFKDGIVMQEFRRGFVLGERLLRPAMVKVSAGPGAPSTEESTEPSIVESAEPSTVESIEQPQTAGVDEQ